MIPVKVLGLHKVYNPAFNFTLKMMDSYGATEGNTENYKKMVALASKTCYSLIEGVENQMLLPLALKGEDEVAILVMNHPPSEEYVMLEVFLEEQDDGSLGVALIENIVRSDD